MISPVIGPVDSQLGPGQRLAGRAPAASIQRIDREDRRGLGETVALVDGQAQGLEVIVEFVAQRRTATDEGSDLASEFLVDPGEDLAPQVLAEGLVDGLAELARLGHQVGLQL